MPTPGTSSTTSPQGTKGKIGKRTLVPDERKAIIEYLKTL